MALPEHLIPLPGSQVRSRMLGGFIQPPECAVQQVPQEKHIQQQNGGACSLEAYVSQVFTLVDRLYPEPFVLPWGVQLDFDQKEIIWTQKEYSTSPYIQRFVKKQSSSVLSPYKVQYEDVLYTVGDFYRVDASFYQLKGFLPRLNYSGTKNAHIDILGVFGENGAYQYALESVNRHMKKSIPDAGTIYLAHS